jgi:DNA replication and repair protein RecF
VKVQSLEVFQYRNFDRERAAFSPGTNIFVGRNGQGKTNLLEAIYLLGYGRSFRTSSPRECIRHGASECLVEGVAEHDTITRKLQVAITQSLKSLFVHAKAASLEDFLGNLHVLAFTGQHLKIVRGGPAERRSFLDRAMLTLFPGHIRYLADYGRALRQRNSVLSSARSSGRGVDDHLLDSWDETLVKGGAPLIANRRAYAASMKEMLPTAIFGEEKLALHYISPVRDEACGIEEIESAFRIRLRQARARDLQLGFTTVGPHRDDLKLFLDGKPLAEFGSAGQQRSALLSLYFAQMEIHQHTHGFYPVFLVDDVEAELDDERLRIFLRYLTDRTQTFLTTAKESLLPALSGSGRRFEISQGKITG